MNEEKNTEELSLFLKSQGFFLFGVGYIKDILENSPCLNLELTRDLVYGISIAVPLSSIIIEEIKDHPTRTYLFHYKRVNILLDNIAIKTASWIQDKGYKAFPVPASFIVDWENQYAHISHKMVAYKAGLGWIGRNNLLINEKFGARIRLVSILTNMPFITAKPIKKDCKNCKACIEVCPAGAIGENYKDFNRLACFEKLKFFAKKYSLGSHYICGICVKACKGNLTSSK